MKKTLTDRTRRLLCWIPAGLLSALCIAAALLFLDARYALNDDAAILRAFLGCEGGVIADFLPHQHELITWPLSRLSRLFPNQPWFSYLQLALLWFGFTVIGKTLLQLTLRHRSAHLAAFGIVTAILGTMGLYVCARITYTQTAAVLIAAAAVELLSLQHETAKRGESLRCLLLSLLLLAFAYGLRLELLPIGLAFCGLCGLWQLLHIKKSNPSLCKTYGVALLCCVLVMGGLFAERMWRVEQPDVKDYMDWHEVRIDVLDYHDLSDLPHELLEQIGWDETTVALAQESCFLPPEINTEALQRIKSYYDTQGGLPFSRRLGTAVQAMTSTLTSEDIKQPTAWPFWTCIGLAVLSLTGLLLQKESKMLTFLLWICITIGSLLLLVYLSLQGRTPFRALYAVLLPASVLYAAVLCRALSSITTPVFGAVMFAFSVAAAIGCILLCLRTLPIDKEQALEVGDPAAYLDEYAAYDEGCLYLYDYTLSGIENRLFPQSIDGTYPQNVSFFGGWRMFSEGSLRQFESYGLDLTHRENDLLLSENIVIATGVCEPLVPKLTAWLQQHVDSAIEPMIWGEDGGIYYICFQ